MAHTPLPWKSVESFIDWERGDSTETTQLYSESSKQWVAHFLNKEDAELARKAVNAFEPMREALESCQKMLIEFWPAQCDSQEHENEFSAVAAVKGNIRAALALADKEQQ